MMPNLKKYSDGRQGKIYIRPIQNSLTSMALAREENTSNLKQKCKLCLTSFPSLNFEGTLKNVPLLDMTLTMDS